MSLKVQNHIHARPGRKCKRIARQVLDQITGNPLRGCGDMINDRRVGMTPALDLATGEGGGPGVGDLDMGRKIALDARGEPQRGKIRRDGFVDVSKGNLKRGGHGE